MIKKEHIDELPLVSVSTITFNHKDFIARCIEGVLSQKTNFKIEYLIHDDCSTDGTTEIIKQYADKYPDIIKPMYEEENQYSKGGPWGSIVFNYPRAKGKYIALCEGDDCWTDPYKLQKQVDFLESHPDYSVCFHRYINCNIYSNEKLTDQYGTLFPTTDIEYVDVSVEMMFGKYFLMPLTEMFRNGCLDFSLVYKYHHYRDTHENYHLMKNGKCALMAFVGAQRNMHNGGVASLIPSKQLMQGSIAIAKELYNTNLDEATRIYYLSILNWAMMFCKPLSFDRLKYSYCAFKLNKNLYIFIKNLLHS